MRSTGVPALLAAGVLCAACATVSGLDGLNEVDDTSDASIDQSSAPAADGGGTGSGDGGVGVMGTDAGTGKGDAGTILDAGKDTGPAVPIPSIMCGVSKCTGASQLCCYNRLTPKASTCEQLDAAAACIPALNKDPLYCDDKADCPSSKPFCCFDKAGTASCDTEANCAAGNGRFLCSTLADCPDASINCSAGAGVFNLVVCK
jgi:hypothetical protein